MTWVQSSIVQENSPQRLPFYRTSQRLPKEISTWIYAYNDKRNRGAPDYKTSKPYSKLMVVDS